MTIIVDETPKSVTHRHLGKGMKRGGTFRIHHKQEVTISGYVIGERIALVFHPSGRAEVTEGVGGKVVWSHGWSHSKRVSFSDKVTLEPGNYSIGIEGQSSGSGGEVTVQYRERIESRIPYPGATPIPVGPTDMAPGVYPQTPPVTTAPGTGSTTPGTGSTTPAAGSTTPGTTSPGTGLVDYSPGGQAQKDGIGSQLIKIGLPIVGVLGVVWFMRGGLVRG